MMRVLGCRVFSPFSLYVFEWIMDGKFSFGYRRTFNRTAISIRISCLFPPTIFSLSYCLTELFLVLVFLHGKQRNPVRPQSTMVILIYFSFYTHAALNECKIICRFWQRYVQCSCTGNGNYPLIIWFLFSSSNNNSSSTRNCGRHRSRCCCAGGEDGRCWRR